MTSISQAIRGVRAARGLTITAILCIGLGAAATTAVATLVSATLLRDVPFPHADRLVRIWFEEPQVSPRVSLSIPEISDFARMQSFDAFAGTARVRATARLSPGAERMRGEAVSRGYFDLLGLRAAAGRLLDAGDHAAGALPVVVLSHGTWTRHHGGDPTIVGREFRTDRAAYTIVGVAPRGFDGSVEDDVVEFFIPLEQYEPAAMRVNRTSRPAWVIGRLKPGATAASAQAEAEAVARRLSEQHPKIYERRTVRIEPFGESWRTRLREGGIVLFAASALLLMVAAVNVGTLLLARVLDRRRELAVRLALGAGSRRIAQQLLLEATLIVAAGGVLGALAGPWILDAVIAIAPLERLTLPRYVALQPDVTTALLSIGTLAIAGLLAGTIPALVGLKVPPGAVLNESSRGSVGRTTAAGRWTATLVAAQTCLTVVLLVAGALLIRSYDKLADAEMGFDRGRIARLAVTLSPSDVNAPARLPAMYARLREALSSVPGVRAVGLVSPTLPPWEGSRSRVRLDGLELPHAPEGVQAGVHMVDEGLLRVLGAGLVAGRNIDARDEGDAPPVAVISRSLAMLYGGPERAVGRTVRFPDGDAAMPVGPITIAGVVDDIAYDGVVAEDTRHFVPGENLRVGRYDVYLPLVRFPSTVVSIGALTDADPAALIDPLRRRIREIAPASAVHWTSTMEEEIALEYAPARLYTLLVAVFSASALALTSVGLFGLISHTAARRTREMAVRLALGASGVSNALLLLRSGLAPLIAGFAAGAALALVVARAMGSLLFGIGTLDVAAFASAVVCLVVVTAAAVMIPARRIARMDPAAAMRVD